MEIFTNREKYIMCALIGRRRKELECEKYKIEAHPTYSKEETDRLEEIRLLIEENDRIKKKVDSIESVG